MLSFRYDTYKFWAVQTIEGNLFMKLKYLALLSLVILMAGTLISCNPNNGPGFPQKNGTPTVGITNTPTSTPTPNVTIIANFGATSYPWGMHFDTNNNLYIALDPIAAPVTVAKIANPGTSPVTSLAYTGTAASKLYDAVMDTNGNLWLGTGSAQVVEVPAGNGTPVTISTGFYSGSEIYDEVINNAGTTLYAGDYEDGFVYAINLSNPSAGATTIVDFDTAQYPGSGVAFDKSGNLFLGGYDDQVDEITASALASVPVGGYSSATTFAGNGSYLPVNGPALTGAEFWEVYGVAVDPSGSVYATDYYFNALRKISGGQVTTLVCASGSSSNSALTPTFSPTSMGSNDAIYGVACDAAGNVYFSDYTNGNIYRYQP